MSVGKVTFVSELVIAGFVGSGGGWFAFGNLEAVLILTHHHPLFRRGNDTVALKMSSTVVCLTNTCSKIKPNSNLSHPYFFNVIE
jgi:hypothetical protein